MKRSLCTLGLIVAAFAVAQNVVKIQRDRARNMELRGYDEIAYEELTGGKSNFEVWTTSPRRKVVGTWVNQGLAVSGTRLKGSLAPVAGTKGALEVRAFTATGGVTTTKTTTERGARRTTAIQSTRADYRSGGGEGLLTLTGKVTITHRDPKQGQTLVATGSGGNAALDPRAKTGEGLRRATLRGPVRITARKSKEAGGGKFVATGRTLTFNGVSKPAKLTLSGNVILVANEGSAFLNTAPARTVTVFLNEQGEMTRFQMQGGRG